MYKSHKEDIKYLVRVYSGVMATIIKLWQRSHTQTQLECVCV